MKGEVIPCADGRIIRDLGETISIFIPLTLRKRSGRKEMVPPSGQPSAEREPSAWAITLAKAYVWQRWIDEGRYANAQELAKTVGVDASFVRRILRWGGLSPRIVEGTLQGMEPAVSLHELLGVEVPLEWDAQMQLLGSRQDADRVSTAPVRA